jgi:phage-related minor tail protein
MARTLTVQVVGDTKDLERALARAGRQTETFGSKLGGVGKTAAVAKAKSSR